MRGCPEEIRQIKNFAEGRKLLHSTDVREGKHQSRGSQSSGGKRGRGMRDGRVEGGSGVSKKGMENNTPRDTKPKCMTVKQ